MMEEMKPKKTDTEKTAASARAQELLLSRQWMALHVQQTPLAVIEFDLDGLMREWNPAAENIFGYSRDEALGQYWHFIVPQEVRSSLDGVWAGLVSHRRGSRFLNKNVTKDCRIIDCEWFNTPLVDADGNTIGIASLVMDITEHRQIEKKLEQFLTFFETATDLMCIADPNGAFLRTNPACSEVLGYSRAEIISKPFIDFVHPEDKQATIDEMARQIKSGSSLNFENRYICKDGSLRWLSWRATYNKLEGITYAVARDITEQRQTEDKLRQSELFIRSILDTVDEGFIVVDRDYRIITANKAYCSQVGGCDETIIGKHCYEISHKTDKPCFEEGEECATRHAFETGTPHTALHRHKDDKGNILYVETKAFPIKDAYGAVTSVIEVINNITERYLLEEERLKIQKLESIGTLAGGIAHDFNNLLQGVFGYISMAKLTHDNKEKSLSMLAQAEEALNMSVNLTNQLLTFSKGGKPVKKLMRLEPVIENAVKFALSGSHTDYRLDIAPDLWSVEADAGQFAQVIQNIVLNANQAMAGRGIIQISVKNMDIPPRVNLRLPNGGRFVRIDTQDTGTGIPEQNMVKIFDPYFTTKQKGSGLGLATSYSIIRNHGGVIEVTSEENKGSTFSIYLPASMAAEAELATVAPVAVATKKLRVLLMDDEDIVRDVAKEMIAAFGHDVEGAEDGRRAIELFSNAKKSGRPFDLVILDLTVKGGMGGEVAIAKLREIDPKVKAVVSSGYADSPIVADYRNHGFSTVLNKPYRLNSLKDCLSLFFS